MPEKVRIADIGVTALVEVNKKNSTIKAAATTYMKDAVTRVAGSLNPAAWSAMFSTAASKEFTRFTESSGNSPHATPLLGVMQELVRQRDVARGDPPGDIQSERFFAVYDYLAVRKVDQTLATSIASRQREITRSTPDRVMSEQTFKVDQVQLQAWKAAGLTGRDLSSKIREARDDFEKTHETPKDTAGTQTTGVDALVTAYAEQRKTIQTGLERYVEANELTTIVPDMDELFLLLDLSPETRAGRFRLLQQYQNAQRTQQTGGTTGVTTGLDRAMSRVYQYVTGTTPVPRDVENKQKDIT